MFAKPEFHQFADEKLHKACDGSDSKKIKYCVVLEKNQTNNGRPCRFTFGAYMIPYNQFNYMVFTYQGCETLDF